MMSNPYNPFNLHNIPGDHSLVKIFIKNVPSVADLDGFLQEDVMYQMDISEFEDYKAKLVKYRILTLVEEKTLRRVKRKIKNRQFSKQCRLKNKEFEEIRKKEYQQLQLKIKELKKQNEFLKSILLECGHTLPDIC
ncbi:Basic leucine zipper domain-containing protein [Entamoeba marina]